MKRVEVWLKETSEPLVYDAISTYQKGDLFCVYCTDEKVRKFPFIVIHKIVESYGTHDQGSVIYTEVT